MKPSLIVSGELAPDFELEDVNGNSIRLSRIYRNGHVVLAFLRGFL